jgi:fused signal recognition particle receptor
MLMLGWFKKKDKDKSLETSRADGQPVDLVGKEEISEEPLGQVSLQKSVEDTDRGVEQVRSQAEIKDDEKGLFLRLQEQLSKTRDSLVTRVDRLFLGKKEIDAVLLDDLEEILITADLGVNTTLDLLDDVRLRVSRQELNDPQALKLALKEKILSYFAGHEQSAELRMIDDTPFVIMVVGVNGVGKTTTIGKMAHKFVAAGRSVLLVAADTFRAAAIDQLKIWGERVGVDVVAKQPGADPSSVIYDAMDYAVPKGFDVIIVDTAGRLHTKVNLMEELKKIKRVMDKKVAGAPHEVLLILDATTGQNSISQAKLFNETVDITGLALTKLDGTAKGGIVVNISHELKIPIRFIGIGEKLEDLRDFDPHDFIEALFAGSEEN